MNQRKIRIMNIGLQRYIIRKIIEKRGNQLKIETFDIGACLDAIDPRVQLDGNIHFLETEGIILPVPFDEYDNYHEEQMRKMFEEHYKEENNKETERLKSVLWRLYGCKRVVPKLHNEPTHQ